MIILPVGSATGCAGLLVGSGTGDSHTQREKKLFYLFSIKELVETKRIFIWTKVSIFFWKHKEKYRN